LVGKEENEELVAAVAGTCPTPCRPSILFPFSSLDFIINAIIRAGRGVSVFVRSTKSTQGGGNESLIQAANKSTDKRKKKNNISDSCSISPPAGFLLSLFGEKMAVGLD
jgi:hypothetical protein